MKVLIVGSGGREHALAWKCAQSPRVRRVFVAPGNAGTARESKTANVPIAAQDIPALVAFARREQIELTIIGPEAPLVAGIVDAFASASALILVARSHHPRATEPMALVDLVTAAGGHVEAHPTVEAALARARSLAGPRDLICATGSLFVAAEAIALLRPVAA